MLMSSGYFYGQETFSLGEAISYALDHHPTLRVAKLDSDNAVWEYKEAKAYGMPKLNGNLNYTYFYQVPASPVQDFISPAIYGVLIQEQVTTETGTVSPADLPELQTFNFTFQQKNNFSLGLNGEVLLFDGNYLKGLKAAKLFINLAEKQIELTQQDIIQNVARAYQNVLIAEKNIEIIENNISTIVKFLDEAKIVYENGFIEELDVDRLELSKQNLEFEKKKIEEIIDVSHGVLKYQMAYPKDQQIALSEDLETVVNIMTLDYEQSDSIDYKNRAEYRLLIDAIELDEADLVRIKQGYYPSVTGKFGYGQTLQRNNLFDGNETGFLGNGSVGISARIPIYDGGFTKSKIEQKKIEIEKRNIELSEFQRAMTLQIMNAETQYNNAKRSLENANRSLELNEKIFKKTRIKYAEGVGSSVEVTQAEASLYQAQATYINALYDVLSSKTELDIATGEISKNFTK